jgi:solute carrier family 25 carnitine/acylcarnitine transporter 20/29
MESLVVGPVSAVIGWIFSYPQDIIKTRIQVEEYGKYRSWRWCPDGGFVECGKMIYRAAGWRGFWVGLSPCLIRAAYSDGIGIVAY